MALPLSVVVVAYDIARELPRTLRSLAADYQCGIDAADYEVIVVDNGSPNPVDPSIFADLAGNFRLVRIDDAHASPAAAINRGLSEARGEIVGVMVDGARLVTPGFLHFALVGSRVGPRPAVVSLGYYLGYDFQRYALEAGWGKADEDELLASIAWPSDGYRLFEVSTLDESSVDGWFLQVVESNGLFLPAVVWAELGGFDERFDLPGGGLVNHDILRRAHELGDLDWVVLLGEGTFHQLHGGVATNQAADAIASSFEQWKMQYQQLTGRSFDNMWDLPDVVYIGSLPDALWPRFSYALNSRLHAHQRILPPLVPPVPLPEPAPTSDHVAAHLAVSAGVAARDGRTTEAQALARMARDADPAADVSALLSRIATHRPVEELPLERRAELSVDIGRAYLSAGDPVEAETHFRHALSIQPGKTTAYEAMTELRMPGPDYHDRLALIHEELNPARYLEIGVFKGDSLVHARPPTVAVGVDPAPRIQKPVSVELHLYTETSNEFFDNRDVRAIFGGAGPSLVFIDGLHAFTAVLADFARVEAISDPDTLVLLHDMIPFDEVTQRSDQVHEFYTGDVWKLLHCFADVRPDLSWFTIRTPPSGLTVVGGLDPTSTVLRDQYDKLVERYGSLQFEDSIETPGVVVDNDWPKIAKQLAGLRDSSGVRRDGATKGGGSSGPVATTRGTEALRRRVRDLEAADARRRQELDELQRMVRRTGAYGVVLDPQTAQAELERLRSTKLFRWSAPLRRVVQRLRRARPA